MKKIGLTYLTSISIGVGCRSRMKMMRWVGLGIWEAMKNLGDDEDDALGTGEQELHFPFFGLVYSELEGFPAHCREYLRTNTDRFRC